MNHKINTCSTKISPPSSSKEGKAKDSAMERGGSCRNKEAEFTPALKGVKNVLTIYDLQNKAPFRAGGEKDEI